MRKVYFSLGVYYDNKYFWHKQSFGKSIPIKKYPLSQ